MTVPAALNDPVPALAATVDRIDVDDPVFISDLHLAPAAPRTTTMFARFMREVAPRYRELLILGDLFEFWAGDDELQESFALQVADALDAHAERGHPVYVMHGNRDLLLGRGFADAASATLLADPTLAKVAGTPMLLAHGDAWCIDDVAYQRFRAETRAPATQQRFLALPRAQRLAFMGAARAQSEAAKSTKAMDIMDVNPSAVEPALRAAGVHCVVHGHTHRPAVHRFTLDGKPAERWVLPDWDYDAETPRGGYVALDGGSLRAFPFGI